MSSETKKSRTTCDDVQRATRRNKNQEDPTEVSIYYWTEQRDPQGFIKEWIGEHIGYGVFAVKDFKKKDFLLFYPGNVISATKGRELEDNNPAHLGSFYFYFEKLCVDGTHSNGLGKYVNHSSKFPNCVVKPVKIDGGIFIALFALVDIKKDTELRYHYGISGEEWMKNKKADKPYNYHQITANIDDVPEEFPKPQSNPPLKASDVLSLVDFSVSGEKEVVTISDDREDHLNEDNVKAVRLFKDTLEASPLSQEQIKSINLMMESVTPQFITEFTKKYDEEFRSLVAGNTENFRHDVFFSRKSHFADASTKITRNTLMYYDNHCSNLSEESLDELTNNLKKYLGKSIDSDATYLFNVLLPFVLNVLIQVIGQVNEKEAQFYFINHENVDISNKCSDEGHVIQKDEVNEKNQGVLVLSDSDEEEKKEEELPGKSDLGIQTNQVKTVDADSLSVDSKKESLQRVTTDMKRPD